MIRVSEIKLPLDHSEDELRAALLKRLRIRDEQLGEFAVFKRSLDARKRGNILLVYVVDAETTLEDEVLLGRLTKDQKIRLTPDTTYQMVAHAPADLKSRPIVIGAGPCGYFAALLLAQMGYRPIVLERGQPVRQRTKDTFGFWRQREFNAESNVQYGEGGAGTFSDGKLYSQIKDPKHFGRKVLTELVAAGARDEILYVYRPHIGTFRLVKIVEQLRETITELGGEVRFGSQVTELLVEDKQVCGVRLADGSEIASRHVVLAVGHSSRDTFEMLHKKGVFIEPKSFSIGVRIEHPQSMIDKSQYGPQAGHEILGSADYRLVHHCKNGRSVYSFCMCPGGTVLAATSEAGCVVTNGMSQYSRVERNANAGMVVGITPEDFPSDDPLAGIELQREIESLAFRAGGENYDAPGQLVGDFLAGKPSTEFGEVAPSYKPAVKLTDLKECLPDYVIAAMREALPAFDRKIRGYARPDAVMTGVETRTSSPIRITRSKDDLQSLNTRGLFPAGEGAGYAGGILSAGVDGVRVAEAVALAINADS
ncbi:MAG: putative FAD-dependent dehydrogenase [Rhodothermales bacterium]|jgi:uncharacterized FAD-dependent dehydrogenase